MLAESNSACAGNSTEGVKEAPRGWLNRETVLKRAVARLRDDPIQLPTLKWGRFSYGVSRCVPVYLQSLGPL